MRTNSTANFRYHQPGAMRGLRNITWLIMASLLAFFSLAHAQDETSTQGVEETLGNLPQTAAQEFAQPLVNAVGANLNTGWMTMAPEAKMSGLTLRLGLVGVGSFIDGEDDIFQLLGTIFQFQENEARELARMGIAGFDLLPQTQQDAIVEEIATSEFTADVTGPTVFGGENDKLVVTTEAKEITVDNITYIIPSETITFDDVTGLWDKGIFPTVVPQLSLGTFYGTQATIRYLPDVKLSEDIGTLSYFGWGIQHNPLVWFQNPLPVNIAVSFFKQSLKIDEAVKVNPTAYGAQVSKTFGGFLASVTPYAGFLIESSNMDVDYTYEVYPGVTTNIEFELEGENSSRFILGVGANVVGLNLYADYNFSKLNSANITLMYGF